MAFGGSFMQSATVRDMFNNAIAMNVGADSWKIALYSSTCTPSPDTTAAAYNVAPMNTGEVSGTNWAAGGVALTTPACTLVAGVGVKITMDNVSVATTTLTAAHGCLIYDTTVASRSLILVDFTADYSTVAGTFAITWDALGVAQLDLTP